ncbi:hypothetical protein [Streptomyces sp. NPDC004296]|uniref:hypothetical protein n=1 Tax=Streptomyces sp. NPDC004296 TaxID=3364697 RepID=UPI0036C25138
MTTLADLFAALPAPLMIEAVKRRRRGADRWAVLPHLGVAILGRPQGVTATVRQLGERLRVLDVGTLDRPRG